MIKKFFAFIACLISLNMLCATAFEFSCTTPHIVIHFTGVDESTVSGLAEDLEAFYNEISDEFSFSSSYPLHINIYPDTQSFHEALGLVDAQPWMVAKANSYTIDIVSSSSPDLYHSKESMNKIMKLNVTKLIIFNKFGSENVPYWLAYGIGAMKTHYGNAFHSFINIPSLAQLETSKNNDFKIIDGFQVAYAFTTFIEERYGKEVLVDLLTHYESRKNELYQSWINSLSET